MALLELHRGPVAASSTVWLGTKRLGEIANGKPPGRDEERPKLRDVRDAVEADYKANGKKSLDRGRAARRGP
jgi:hypothetical protein